MAKYNDALNAMARLIHMALVEWQEALHEVSSGKRE